MKKLFLILLFSTKATLLAQSDPFGLSNFNTSYATLANNTFTAFQQLPRDIDTADFTGGEGVEASITQTGQVNKILCIALSVPMGNIGVITVSNENITTSSIVSITVEYISEATLAANAIIYGCKITGTGVIEIYFVPTTGDLTDNIWIHYEIK